MTNARANAEELAEALEELEDVNGCCLHIAVMDFNLSDDDLDSCRKTAEEQGHEDCAELAVQFKETIPEEHREAFLGVRSEGNLMMPAPAWRPA